jgi:hypothetical protein
VAVVENEFIGGDVRQQSAMMFGSRAFGHVVVSSAALHNIWDIFIRWSAQTPVIIWLTIRVNEERLATSARDVY